MSIIALRAWYIEKYEPIPELEKRQPDIRISKKSLLKSALRADFLEDSDEVKQSIWFSRYLEGDDIEFYIEGSCGYCVSNIDLISHELFFTHQDLLSQLLTTIFLSYQNEYSESSDALREGLLDTVDKLNLRSRLPLKLIESIRPKDAPMRLGSSMMRKIRRSLLFIADATPISSIDTGKEKPLLVPSANTCIELGYAIQSKRSEQILIAQMQREDKNGEFPFDLTTTQIMQFQNSRELNKILPQTIENVLARFRLFA
ncbi:MAG: hypothetical protein AAFY76_07445 [Cyanobacteria bacterium J06649_11]